MIRLRPLRTLTTALLGTLLVEALLTAAPASAASPTATSPHTIRFARTPDISPDGKLVAFSYLGDIWVVDAAGGVARPVTMHQAHDYSPVFSPDGQSIAFSSNRHGGYDVFIVPVQGGRPRRVTFDSAADSVNDWTPDGRSLLVTSARAADFPATQDLYLIPAEGGRAHRVTPAEGRDGAVSPRGDRIAFVRGPGSWYRKGYRGSANDEIWTCRPDGTDHRRMTTFDGQDGSPMWAPDGQTLYYASEAAGTPANIVRQDAEGKSPPVALTAHKDDAVRRARISRNGDWIVYECGGDLWITPTHGGPARQVAITAYADDKTNPVEQRTFTSAATEFVLSPDENHVAFVVHGSLFLMPTGGGKATRLTDTPAADHGAAWSPDGQKLLFISDRNGHDDVYAVEPNDPEHPRLTEAHRFTARQLTNSPDAESGLAFTPDGKRVAFLRSGQLWTMNPDGSDLRVLIDRKQVIDYEFSPDGKWIAFARLDGSFASELYIMPATGTTAEARNVTRYATWNAGVTWSRTGNKLAFISQRPRTPGLYVLSLQKPAAPGAAPTQDIDWDDIHLRVEQPSLSPAEEAVISPDGSRVAYRSSGSAGDELWVASVPRGQITRLTSGNARPSRIQWSRKDPSAIYFQDGAGNFRKARVGPSGLETLLAASSGPGGARPAGPPEPATIGFSVKMGISREEEFAEIFEQSWRALAEQFYDPKFHGADWYAVRTRYRPLVKHVSHREDLHALIFLMLGELNASHLGISGALPTPEENTADLGLIFDDAYRGPGLKLREVLKRGPADKRGLGLRPGDFVLAIDGNAVNDRTDVSRLLNGKAGETVILQVTPNPLADSRDLKAFRRIEVQAVDRGSLAPLAYDRWVERNARRVAELSQGRLGYIHIPSMDDAGLDRFIRALYSDNFDKDGIVLDVRFNGGGFTHDQVLNYLGAREHTVFRQRHGGEGPVLRSFDRKWARPLTLLINNRSFSDAEIFPSAFKTLGLGKLVGQPTGGFVIGTGTTRLIDGSSFRLPRIGVYTARGDNMDKVGVAPDVFVDAHPDDLARGLDAQLDKAVEVLAADVAAWKKANPRNGRPTLEARPATPPPGGVGSSPTPRSGAPSSPQ